MQAMPGIRAFSFVVVTLCLSPAARAAEASRPADSLAPIMFENKLTRLMLNASGEVLGLVDRRSGTDFADHARPIEFAVVHAGPKEHPVTGAVQAGDRLRLTFGEAGTAELRVAGRGTYF
ncbi:MAG: hypothetical protein HY718_11575, partial [Planctomycetes bacterium]|nr:hypothetical protein [Planctomycetota bacterium]